MKNIIKQFFYLFSFIFIIHNSLIAQTDIIDSTVCGTWTKENSPYNILSYIIVPEDTFLTIEEGVKVKFHGNYLFRIKGEFYVNGTKDEKVIFTINDTTGFSNLDTTLGGWRGIFVDKQSNKPLSINHAIIEFVKNLNAGSILLGKKTGGAIDFYCRYSVSISNTEIRNNYTKGSGAGIAMHMCSINFNKLFIHNNKAISSGGGIFMMMSYVDITNSIICNNTGHAGGGIVVNSYRINMNNCLLTNNKATLFYDEKMQKDYTTNELLFYGIFNADDKKIINNSIIWNTNGGLETGNNIHNINYSNCLISNLDLQSKTYANFKHCIDKDPLFIHPTNGIGAGFESEISDWSLPSNSPAIDFGVYDTLTGSTDILGNPRIFDDSLGIIDAGPFEFQGYPDPQYLTNIEISNQIVYPNPTNGPITFSDKSKLPYRIDIYNILGELVQSFSLKKYPLNQIDISNLNSGIYYLKLYSWMYESIIKIIKIE